MIAAMMTKNTMLVVIVPTPRPPSFVDADSRSPVDAPMGRVRMYAIQKQSTGPRRPMNQTAAVTAMAPAKRSSDGKYPRPSVPR